MSPSSVDRRSSASPAGAQPAIAQELLVAGQRGQFDFLPDRGRRRRASARRQRPAVGHAGRRSARPSTDRRCADRPGGRPARRSSRPATGSAPPAGRRRARRRGRRAAPRCSPRNGARSTTPCRPPRRLATPANQGWVCGTGSTLPSGEDLARLVQRKQQALRRHIDRQPRLHARLGARRLHAAGQAALQFAQGFLLAIDAPAAAAGRSAAGLSRRP